MHHITRRLSPSLIVAIVALFVALAGTAAASSVLGSNDARGKSTSKAAAGEAQSLAALNCETGNVLGFARVKGKSSIPPGYTNNSALIDITRNCGSAPPTSPSVVVRRASPGVYFVKFVNNPAKLALVTSNEDGDASTELSGDDDNIVTVGKITSGPDQDSFRVDVQDVDSGAPDGHKHQDGQFTILLP